MSWFRGMYEILVSYSLVSYYLACLKNVYCPLAGTSAYQMTWLTHLVLLSESSMNLNSLMSFSIQVAFKFSLKKIKKHSIPYNML